MTSQTLEEYQKLFSDNLLTEHLSCKSTEKILKHIIPIQAGLDPLEEAMDRFSIYRNNVILSLSTALADTYPVIKRLVGDECFKAAAIAFVRQNPPQQASLLFYGEEFIEFIQQFESCRQLAYLEDIARLEWSTVKAFHAADVDLLDNSQLEKVDPEALSRVSFNLHPSAYLMRSAWPVDTIWQENLKQDVALINLQQYSGCNLLIYRQDTKLEQQVQVVNLTTDCFNLLEAFSQGKNIADAWDSTVMRQQQEKRDGLDESELSAMLGYLLSLSIFTSTIKLG